MKLSKSQAGKLGAEKSKETQKAQKDARVSEYNLSPTCCANCNNALSYDERHKKFCSSSCAATFNNRKRKTAKFCQNCGQELCGNQKKYCSISCQKEFEYKQRVSSGNLGSRKVLKRFIVERDGYECCQCGISEWNGKEITLELEHKDGNSENNDPSNLCLLCPNCHSQTMTYKGRNKGNGRHYRRVRYREGKSF